MTTRADVVAEARTWIGTPWHHAARLKGVGVDCVGLLIGVARELGIVTSDFDIPAYVQGPDGTMLYWCNRYLTPIPGSELQPGDIVVLVPDLLPQHMGILGDYRNGGLSIIHAASNEHPPRVLETRLLFSRASRFAAAYSFPKVI